jgi:hypothetical protein
MRLCGLVRDVVVSQKEKVGKARKVKKPANRVPPPPAAPTPVVLDGVTLPPGLARVWEACLKEDKVSVCVCVCVGVCVCVRGL